MSEKTMEKREKGRLAKLIDSFGLPRLIITLFLLLLLILAPFVGADLPTQITNIIARFSWNGILVLAMVPMVHSGCGLNFGLPLGIISGLLGATISICGPVTFRNNRRTVEVVQAIPPEFLTVETDSPYLAPEPKRGRPNMPPYVEYVARRVAVLKGMSYEDIAAITCENAKRFYGI